MSLCERGLAKRLFGKAWESIGHCLVLLACQYWMRSFGEESWEAR